MNLTISGHQLDITDSLRHFVTDRMDRLERHSNEVHNVHVVLNVEKHLQTATATVSVKGAQLFANTKDESMYTAIDQLTTKLDRQLIKHEKKSQCFDRQKHYEEAEMA